MIANNDGIGRHEVDPKHLNFTAGEVSSTVGGSGGGSGGGAGGTGAPLFARYVFTDNVADLTTPGSPDGTALVEGDVVVLAYQSSPDENGLYYTNSSGELIRSGTALTPLMLINITEGTKWGGTVWQIMNYTTFIVGSDELTIMPLTTNFALEDSGYSRGAWTLKAGTNVTITPSGSSPYRYALTINASASSGGTVDTQDFVSSGTWTKPANAKRVELYCIGAGGGGGSGARGLSGTNHSGGGGGGAGQMVIAALLASDCSSTETVTIGGGGTGGAAKTADGAGNDGSVGGDTSFGMLVVAKGGNFGLGGVTTTLAANGGTLQTNYNRFTPQGQNSGGGSASNSSNAPTVADHVLMSNRGGGGGTISSSGSDRFPAAGGAVISPSGSTICAAGSGGGSTGASGSGGNFSNVYLLGSGGGGGYCGDSGGTVAGGSGGAGGGYGAGGGGGGSSITGANSGAGGAGADGFLRIITYCG